MLHHIVGKNKLPHFFHNQFIPNFIVIIFAIFLTYKKYSPIISCISIVILYYYSYFIHKLCHYLPDIINIHLNYHHNADKNKTFITEIFNLAIELFTNIMFFVGFFYIQKISRIHFIPEILIFYYGFIYVSVHIINYSIFHVSNSHVLHHTNSNQIEKNKTKTCNYGPDLVDHIFKTNCNKRIENYNHILPNIILAGLFTYYLYNPHIF